MYMATPIWSSSLECFKVYSYKGQGPDGPHHKASVDVPVLLVVDVARVPVAVHEALVLAARHNRFAEGPVLLHQLARRAGEYHVVRVHDRDDLVHVWLRLQEPQEQRGEGLEAFPGNAFADDLGAVAPEPGRGFPFAEHLVAVRCDANDPHGTFFTGNIFLAPELVVSAATAIIVADAISTTAHAKG